MEVKEILELIEEGYTSEDKEYKNKVYFISYFLSSLIFVLIHLFVSYWSFNILFIVSMLLIVGAILILRHRLLYKKTKCYFDKIFEKIVGYGVIIVIVSSIITLYTHPRIFGTIVAQILGFLLVIDGVLFKSKKREILGVFMIFSSILMFVFHQYQFLIFALIQFIVAISFLVFKN
jgi:hypothetical protein